MLGSTSIPLWVVHGALHSSEKSCGEPYCFLFIMVRHGGKSFSDVYMCTHRTIGGFMNVVCVLFFFFLFSWHASCLSTVFRFILAWFLFMWLCLSRLLIILVDSTYGPTWLPPDDMRILDWNQTRMRQGQWKSSTLDCFVVFIFANTRRVVCVIKISAIRLGLGLRRTRTTWLAKPFLSQERSNMHVDSLEHTHFCPLGD